MSVASVPRRRPRMRASLESLGRVAWLPAVLLLLGFGILFALAGVRTGVWQLDEYSYVGVARHVADVGWSGLFEWTFYERGIQRLSIWLMTPGYVFWEAHGGLVWGHWVQALAYATSGIPAYLLARGLGLKPGWATVPALLTVLTPWSVVATSFLTEPVAYAAWVWFLYFTWRALVRPSVGNDLLALFGAFLAVLSRTGFVVLLPVVPAAAVLFAGRDVLRRHRVLLGATALGGALVLARVALSGGISSVTGGYARPRVDGPEQLIRDTFTYFSRVVTGTGFVATAVGVPWLLAGLLRRRDDGARFAFALVALLSSAALIVQLGAAGPDERYVMYFAAPVFVGVTAALVRRDISLLAVAAGFAVCLWLVLTQAWDKNLTSFANFAFPAEVFWHDVVLGRLSVRPLSALPGSTDLAIALIAIGLAAVTLVALRVRRHAALAAALVLGALLAAQVVQTNYTFRKFDQKLAGKVAGAPPGDRSFIDRRLPANEDAGLWAIGRGDMEDYGGVWRDLEFWNTQLKAVVVDRPAPDKAPFPPSGEGRLVRLNVDDATGEVDVEGKLPALLLIPNEISTLGLQVTPRQASYAPVNVVTVPRPVRANWKISGMDPDGWLRKGMTATIRVFVPPGERQRCLTLTILAPPGFKGRRAYAVRGGGGPPLRGTLRDQEARELPLVAHPAAGKRFADIRVTAPGGVPYPDGRDVAVRMTALGLTGCR